MGSERGGKPTGGELNGLLALNVARMRAGTGGNGSRVVGRGHAEWARNKSRWLSSK